MSRSGRKRKANASREPNGRIQRPTAEQREADRLRREAGERATVLAQPHRRGNYDQLCASALGRHILAHNLRRELYDAGEEYAATTKRWRAAKGVPVGFTAAGAGRGVGLDAEAVGRLQSRLAAMRASVLRDCGSACLSALDRVALDDATLPGPITFRVTSALLALSHHLGTIPAGSHPYR